MSEKEKDYIRLYEEEKSRREKIEKDYCLLNEKMKDINKKTEEMVKNVQERETLIKNYESQHKNDIEKYKNQYEDMKNQKEKAEKDYICLVEQFKYTNGKTDEMNKRIQELEAVLTNFEQRNKNNLEKYEKSCQENEELKKEIIRVNDEKNTYERGITKLIYTLGKK